MSEKIATAVSYSASAITTITGLTINEWVALGGLCIGLATFIVNLWYRREYLKLQRQREAHDQKR